MHASGGHWSTLENGLRTTPASVPPPVVVGRRDVEHVMCRSRRARPSCSRHRPGRTPRTDVCALPGSLPGGACSRSRSPPNSPPSRRAAAFARRCARSAERRPGFRPPAAAPGHRPRANCGRPGLLRARRDRPFSHSRARTPRMPGPLRRPPGPEPNAARTGRPRTVSQRHHSYPVPSAARPIPAIHASRPDGSSRQAYAPGQHGHPTRTRNQQPRQPGSRACRVVPAQIQEQCAAASGTP